MQISLAQQELFGIWPFKTTALINVQKVLPLTSNALRLPS